MADIYLSAEHDHPLLTDALSLLRGHTILFGDSLTERHQAIRQAQAIVILPERCDDNCLPNCYDDTWEEDAEISLAIGKHPIAYTADPDMYSWMHESPILIETAFITSHTIAMRWENVVLPRAKLGMHVIKRTERQGRDKFRRCLDQELGHGLLYARREDLSDKMQYACKNCHATLYEGIPEKKIIPVLLPSRLIGD